MSDRDGADWRVDDAPIFVDTNILYYAYDRDAGKKHEKAVEILKVCFSTRRGRISTQVIQELSYNLWKNLKHRSPAATINSILDSYADWPLHRPTFSEVLQANSLVEKRKISFRDSLIVLSALASGARWFLTEDLNSSEKFGVLTIVNPLT